MKFIPRGSFQMGSLESEPGALDDEHPLHKVALTGSFWLAETECTQALWLAVMGNNPSHFQGTERPVELVSWNDVQLFLTRLNTLVLNLDARLPTEAEWEYAARTGTTTSREAFLQ